MTLGAALVLAGLAVFVAAHLVAMLLLEPHGQTDAPERNER